MTKGIVGFVSAVKAIHPNSVSTHVLYKPKDVKTRDKFENYAIDPIGMLIKTKDAVLGVNYQKLFKIFNDRILIRIKENEKKNQSRISQNRIYHPCPSKPIRRKSTRRTNIMSGLSMICRIRKTYGALCQRPRRTL